MHKLNINRLYSLFDSLLAFWLSVEATSSMGLGYSDLTVLILRLFFFLVLARGLGYAMPSFAWWSDGFAACSASAKPYGA